MPIGSWVRLAYIGDYSPMDDIPPVTALHDGARRPMGSWVRLAYIRDLPIWMKKRRKTIS